MAASQRRWQPRLLARRQSESVLAGGMVTAAYCCDRTAAALDLRQGGTNGGNGRVASVFDGNRFLIVFVHVYSAFLFIFGFFHI
jgi:hypothetical protein